MMPCFDKNGTEPVSKNVESLPFSKFVPAKVVLLGLQAMATGKDAAQSNHCTQ
jgi:hypothetical protein